MGFKSVKSYNEEKFGGMFMLRNDGDYADVIFLYRSEDDVLVADTHYIKSAEYSGYAHCCGKGCPACKKGIRVQTRLFIPLFNATEGEIQFFDRTMSFEPQLRRDVFANYPNPSEFVFRITRHGAARDINTYYSIQVVGKNSTTPYDMILASQNIKMPDHYSTICKDLSISEMQTMLDANQEAVSSDDMPSYQISPRATSYSNTPTIPEVPAPSVSIPMPDASSVPSPDDVDDYEELTDNVSF